MTTSCAGWPRTRPPASSRSRALPAPAARRRRSMRLT
nr:MAG TPA: Putative TetR-family transcriptional regulator [Caudoviricetes sp.]